MTGPVKRCFCNFLLFDEVHDQLRSEQIIIVEGDRITSVEERAVQNEYVEYETRLFSQIGAR